MPLEVFDTFLRFAEEQGLTVPFKFGVRLCKVAKDGTVRYLRLYIGTLEVTGMVANILGKKVSRAKDTYGCLIVHGCGMDMAFAVVDSLWQRALTMGAHVYFDHTDYIFIDK